MKQSIQILTAIALVCICFTAQAQVKPIPRVGINSSGVEATLQDISAEGRAGWNAGLDFRIGDGALFLQPGAHYYSYSTNLVDYDDIEDFPFEDQAAVQSVKLPLNIGLNLLPKNGLLGIHVLGGVTPTFVTGVSEAPNFAFGKEDLNTLTWGANVGVGVDVLFLTVSANYEIGLTDYFQNATGANNVFTLSAGLKF